MLNIIKLILLAYLVFMGAFLTLGIVWTLCGLILTRNAVMLLAFLSSVVGTMYVLWVVRFV